MSSVWGPKERPPFEALKETLTDADVLAYPRSLTPVLPVRRRLCHRHALVGALSQLLVDGPSRPVAYLVLRCAPAHPLVTAQAAHQSRESLLCADSAPVWYQELRIVALACQWAVR